MKEGHEKMYSYDSLRYALFDLMWKKKVDMDIIQRTWLLQSNVQQNISSLHSARDMRVNYATID
jgi:hypothetical protein